MKKEYKIALLVIGLLLIISGVSYAYWMITHTQETANVLDSGCFSISFTDENNINLSKQFPISDESGLETTPYTFTITNTCTVNTTYQINLETINTSTFSTSYVKAALNVSGFIATSQILSNYTSVSTTLDNASDSRMLKTGSLNAGETKTYELRLWVDKDTPLISDSAKSYTSKIVVLSTATKVAGPAEPELYQGMIPVTYDASGNVIVADTSTAWYNYTDHNWANAVLVDCSNTTIKDKYFNSDMSIKSSVIGTTMDMSEILQMYVWIPRYKYLLWNAENGSSDEQAITIVFEDKTTAKSSGSTNGTYLTHPAFTFGTTELNGIWVGKFENSGTTTNLTIKPNLTSLTSINVGTMFNTIRGVETNTSYGLSSEAVDTHMMKNMEWGAVAYLSSSIYGRYTNSTTCISSGCEVWINNVNTGYGSGTAVTGVPQYGPSITGCAGSSTSAGWVSSMTACSTGYDWTTLGVNASTSGNQYGIYDMSGGASDVVMGFMADSNENYFYSETGIVDPGSKYYDLYSYSETNYLDHERGKLGDSTKETLKTFGNKNGGWYNDMMSMPSLSHGIINRGLYYLYSTVAGIFSNNTNNASASSCYSFRSVLTSE